MDIRRNLFCLKSKGQKNEKAILKIQVKAEKVTEAP
jgi:hypothetical protein